MCARLAPSTGVPGSSRLRGPLRADEVMQWTDEYRPRHEELRRFRAEAAEFMGTDGAKK